MWRETLFWFCGAGLFYIYVGYPALITLLAQVAGKAHRREDFDQPFSVLMVAHNESRNIRAKLASILNGKHTATLCEVVVASDGSTDDTDQIVRSYPDPKVRLLTWDKRRGKAAVINDALPGCVGDCVILTDARQELHPAALRELLANFADPQIGVVSGELVFRTSAGDSPAAQGLGTYWTYEKFIRKQESRFGSVPGATGALYAIRRNLFSPIPPDTLLDDVVIPMQAIGQGFRCVFEERARVYDEPSISPAQEAIRKRRTIAGMVQVLLWFPGWLWPGRNPIWFQFISHKVLRLFSPFLLIGLLVMNLLLLDQPGYPVMLVGQGLFYTLAAAGWESQKAGKKIRALGAPLMFVSLNLNTLLAWRDACTGQLKVTWERSMNHRA